jgi:hypothetical protein
MGRGREVAPGVSIRAAAVFTAPGRDVPRNALAPGLTRDGVLAMMRADPRLAAGATFARRPAPREAAAAASMDGFFAAVRAAALALPAERPCGFVCLEVGMRFLPTCEFICVLGLPGNILEINTPTNQPLATYRPLPPRKRAAAPRASTSCT